eukprot:m.84911 g.84911  ORF g.84911 m.84911 type:complete len:596 (+) comp14408_c0_seq1:2-1789(+)
MRSLPLDTVPILLDSPHSFRTSSGPGLHHNASSISGILPDTTPLPHNPTNHAFRQLPMGSFTTHWNISKPSLTPLFPDAVPLGSSPSTHSFRDVCGSFRGGTLQYEDAIWCDAIPLLQDSPHKFRDRSQPFKTGALRQSLSLPPDAVPVGNPLNHSFRESADAFWLPMGNAADAIKPLQLDTSVTPSEVVFRELERLGFNKDWNSALKPQARNDALDTTPLGQHPSNHTFRESSGRLRFGSVDHTQIVDTEPLQRPVSQHSFRDEAISKKWHPVPARSSWNDSTLFDTTPLPARRQPIRDLERSSSWNVSTHAPDFFWDYAGASFGKSLKSAEDSPRLRRQSSHEYAPMSDEPLYEVLQKFQFRGSTPSEPSPRASRWNTSTRVEQPKFDMSIMVEPKPQDRFHFSDDEEDDEELLVTRRSSRAEAYGFTNARWRVSLQLDGQSRPTTAGSSKSSRRKSAPTGTTPAMSRKRRRPSSAGSTTASEMRLSPVPSRSVASITSHHEALIEHPEEEQDEQEKSVPVESFHQLPVHETQEPVLDAPEGWLPTDEPDHKTTSSPKKMSAISRIIDRKPRLSANALERLAKLRDLIEQQQT